MFLKVFWTTVKMLSRCSTRNDRFFFFYLQEQKYIIDAQNAWQQAWDILQEEKDWSLEAGIEPCKGCVYARKFNKLGKIFRLEVRDKNQVEIYLPSATVVAGR